MTDLKEYLEPCKKLAIVAFGPKATCEINEDNDNPKLKIKIGDRYSGIIGYAKGRWYAVAYAYIPGNQDQPPDIDDVDLGTFRGFDQAFLALALTYAKDILSNAIEMVFK